MPIAMARKLESSTGGSDAKLKVWQQELSEASPDELRPGMIKLGLAAISAVVVYGLLWLICLAQLGGHSLAGWLLVGMLLVWRAVMWGWDFVLWDPPAWYPLQVRGSATWLHCKCRHVDQHAV